MKTKLIILGFLIIFMIAYSTQIDIKKIKKQQIEIHQQDSTKWVEINNRFKRNI